MKRSTMYWLIGGSLVAAGGVGYYLYKKNQAAALPAAPGSAPALTPVTSFENGKSYKFGGDLTPSITDTSLLQSILEDAGWSNVTILFFAGSGDASGFLIGTNGYVAQGTWTRATTPVPNGVFALAA